MSRNQKHFYFGGDYNPEQWDRSVWQEDMRLMADAGVNFVSINIFGWARLQPNEDTFDFRMLDQVMDMLAAHHIGADLATATAAPPAWLSHKYPQSLPVDKTGIRLLPGSRQHYCPNSPDYRQLAARLVEKIAERYREHPALIMWHVNNEYGCHVSECYCDTCKAKFQRWLRDKYQTIDRLNAAWSTDFWSQIYYDWSEINLPGKMPTHVNPNHQLDYKRFMNVSMLELFEMERRIIKRYTPNSPVMTNLMGLHKPINGFMWAKSMDVATWDGYPDPHQRLPYQTFMAHDLTRSLKKKPFLLMEQAPSAVNWRAQNAVKAPGVMRLWSYEAIAHGADGIMFFQWRASQGGAEKFHSGIVPHSGDENSRTFQEVRALGQELKRCDELIGSSFASEVAIVFDWENWWALELDSKPSNLVHYIDQLLQYYRLLHQLSIPVTFIHPEDDLSAFLFVLAPASYQVSQRFADMLKAYIRAGGVFLTNFFSGIVDKTDRVYLGSYPGAYRELLGLTVEEFAPMVKGETGTIRTPLGEQPIRLWREAIHLEGAQALATFQDSYLNDWPAITHNAYGSGQAYYVGTQPEAGYLKDLLRAILAEAGIEPPLTVPEGIEVTVRKSKEDAIFYFILNHTQDQKMFVIDAPMINLLNGEEEKDMVKLSGKDVKILKRQIREEKFDPAN